MKLHAPTNLHTQQNRPLASTLEKKHWIITMEVFFNSSNQTSKKSTIIILQVTYANVGDRWLHWLMFNFAYILATLKMP